MLNLSKYEDAAISFDKLRMRPRLKAIDARVKPGHDEIGLRGIGARHDAGIM